GTFFPLTPSLPHPLIPHPSLELVPHRLDAGDSIHQGLVGRFEILHQRPLVSSDQNGKDITVESRPPHRRMITAIDEKRVAMPRHHHVRFLPTAIVIVAELRTETGFGTVTVMIRFLEIGLVRRTLGVVLVRRISGPATIVA